MADLGEAQRVLGALPVGVLDALAKRVGVRLIRKEEVHARLRALYQTLVRHASLLEKAPQEDPGRVAVSKPLKLWVEFLKKRKLEDPEVRSITDTVEASIAKILRAARVLAESRVAPRERSDRQRSNPSIEVSPEDLDRLLGGLVAMKVRDESGGAKSLFSTMKFAQFGPLSQAELNELTRKVAKRAPRAKHT